MFDNFDKIVLTKEERDILNKFDDSGKAVLTQQEYMIMYRLSFVNPVWDSPSDSIYRLNNNGLHYRTFFLNNQNQEQRLKFRIWLPVLIDSILSIAAITISIIALVKTGS